MTKTLRTLARVIVQDGNRILLVRNKGANFWYPPGGGWEFEHETIQECAAREVHEETGYSVAITRMLWLQEFHENDKIFFETFWLAELAPHNTQTPEGLAKHLDHDPDGMVEEAKWYTEVELKNLKVFPKRAQTFSNLSLEGGIDPFIGSFL